MDRTGKEHAEPLLADIAELKAVAAMLFVAGTYGFLDWKWRDDEREPHSLVPLFQFGVVPLGLVHGCIGLHKQRLDDLKNLWLIIFVTQMISHKK
jgi:hypothetical protein